MRREHVVLHSLAVGDSDLVAYGHYGRPVLAFPSDAGRAFDYEDRGLIGAVSGLVEDGRVKIYCIDSYDRASWRNDSLPLEERAKAHQRYEDYVLNDVVPAIYADCAGPADVMVMGVSFGAFHAANFALRRGDLFPLALCLSGVYDMSHIGWGERGDAFYFTNPMDYVANMEGEHLDWIRSRVRLLLVCGQGMWEDDSASGALPSTQRFDALLTAKGIPHETDLWGYDVPHDWPSWQAQLAHHLPRFV
jgi:esterase/lipase superfamily enzyme